jgi:hypothetical protein
VAGLGEAVGGLGVAFRVVWLGVAVGADLHRVGANQSPGDREARFLAWATR